MIPAAAATAVKAAKVAKKVGGHRWWWAVAGVVVLSVGGPMLVIIVALGGIRPPEPAEAAPVADIPPVALAAYRDAGEVWEMDWAILAGIGKLECDHGRAQLEGCNPADTMNSAGARGFMQFIGSTWRRGLDQHALEPRDSPPAADGQGYATDGDGDGDADPWSWPDAAHSAARYLSANDVQNDPRGAVWRYNHSDTYVDRVLELAETYRNTTTGDATGGLVTVQGITVAASIADRVDALVSAAAADGLVLSGGGYRSADQQIALRRAHCGTSQYAIYEMPAGQCSPPTARPGTSNHERGLAIDFRCNGTSISSHSSPCFRWLDDHAASYGLRNLPSEPWHWSIDGR